MSKKHQRGLTLVEIMVVIVIIGLISAIVFVSVAGSLDKAKVQSAKTQIDVFSNALELYRLSINNYPTTEQGLQALIEAPTNIPHPEAYPAAGFLMKKKIPLDPWGAPFQYRRTQNGYEIISYGADGQEGGEGLDADITN
ncbi:MAG: type II secretion system major pseudopilin GspG [bacterium]